jgi:hypothetical protein
MKNRCTNPNNKDHALYAGRGIRLALRWEIFENFLADMGERPPGMSIDRIDNNGNYEPGNCRWATSKEQTRNKRVNRMVLWRGQSLCLVEWADRVGIPRSVLNDRLRRGWTVDRAFTTPVQTAGIRRNAPAFTSICKYAEACQS